MYDCVGWAIFGGLAINVMRVIKLRQLPKESRICLKDWLYWFQFFIVPIIGGGICWAYIDSQAVLKPIMSVQLGASTPLLLKMFAGQGPSDDNNIEP